MLGQHHLMNSSNQMALAPVLALNYNLEAWNINSDSKSPRTKEHTRDVPDHVTHLTIYRPETRHLGELINVASCKWVRTKQGCSAHSLPTLHGMKTDFLSRAAWLFIYRGATQGFPTSLPTLRKWRESGNSWDSAGHWILNTVYSCMSWLIERRAVGSMWLPSGISGVLNCRLK